MDKQRKTFLSYSRINKDFALKLARELKAEGFSVWLDQLDIPAGARWDREVERALKESEIFMIILTPASANSENVLDEIGYAIDTGKHILPVLLENCEVPLRLRRFQYVDFTTKRFDDGVQSAKELLQHLIAQLPSRLEGSAHISSGQAVATAGKVLEAEGPSKSTASTAPVPGKFPLPGVTLKTLAIAVVIILMVGLAYNFLTNRASNQPPVPTSPPETAAILPPATSSIPASVTRTAPTAAPASTVTLAPTPVPTLGIDSYLISEIDGMRLLYVPAGEFIMGSDGGRYDEAPAHTVFLDAFWIDETEVTKAKYAKCVQAGACTAPASQDPRNYYHSGDAKYNDYPVIFVNWSMANAYCTWAGRRLPTEAEWEKAARGENGATYSWGEAAPSVDLLNFRPNGLGSANQVGTYPGGASPYGALDMAGNVWEWVADYYADDYYKQSPSSNPQGPTEERTDRIVRGCSFDCNAYGVNASRRLQEGPDNTYSGVGFRCAKTP